MADRTPPYALSDPSGERDESWIGTDGSADRPSGVLGSDALALRAEPSSPTGRRPARRGHLRAVPDPVDEPIEEKVADEPVVVAPVVEPEPIAAPILPPAPLVAPPPDRRTHHHRRVQLRSELTSLLVIVLIGTAAALGVDALFSHADGQPPAYLFVFMALPVWDLLPRRLVSRLIATAALTIVAVVGWIALAAIPVPRWTGLDGGVWTGEFAFGAACLGTGLLCLAGFAVASRIRE